MTIYTTKTCQYCATVKRFLDMKGVSYKVVDVTDDSETRLMLQKKYNAMTVPITVNGDKFVVGWNPGKLSGII